MSDGWVAAERGVAAVMVVRAGEVGSRTSTTPTEAPQAFSGWTNTFTDPRLCAAIIDRLTVAGLIIDTGTRSHRLA